MTNELLKTCPFCGNQPYPNSAVSDHNTGTRSMQCTGCFTLGPEAADEEQAMAAWNRREDPIPPEELRDCPFCGGEAWLAHWECGGEEGWTPRCTCQAQLASFPSQAQAIAAWNNRPDPIPPTDLEIALGSKE